MAEFTHNSTTHSITQQTLFFLMMGYEPHTYPLLAKPSSPTWKILTDLSTTQDNAQAAHKVAQQKMKEWITAKFSPWETGDKVWLETSNLHMNGPKKLQMKWTGLFEIEEVISWMAFHLRIPSQWKIHPVFHTSLLTTYKETSEHGPNFLQPLPDLIDRGEAYKVEVVLGHCGKPGCRTFLIKWKGYPASEDTWELEWNQGNAQPLITEYKIAQPADFPEYNHHHKARKQKLWTSLSLLLSLWPLTSFYSHSLVFYVICCGTLWTLTPAPNLWYLGRGNPLSPGNYRIPLQIEKTCRSSPITVQVISTGRGYKVFHKACSLQSHYALHPEHPCQWNSHPFLLPPCHSEGDLSLGPTAPRSLGFSLDFPWISLLPHCP